MEENYKDSLILKRNVDSNNNTIAIDKLDIKQVMDNHSCIVLEQIPEESYGLNINGFSEVYDSEHIGVDNYKVSYAHGVVYFNPVNVGKTIQIGYKGIGSEVIYCSRIASKIDVYGNVVETIEELIGEGKKYLELIKTLGDSVVIINKLEQDIVTGVDLHTKLLEDIRVATPLQRDLHQDVTEGNVLYPKLHQDVVDGTVLEPKLKQAVAEAKIVKPLLDQSIIDAQDDINTINATGNFERTILASEWGDNTGGDIPSLFKCNVQHDMNSLHIISTLRDVNGNSIPDTSRVIDKMNIMIYSDERIEMKVILSARYYKATVTISDNIAEEVVRARGTNVDLKERMDRFSTDLAEIAHRLSSKQLTDIDDTERLKRTLEILPSGATLHLDDIIIREPIYLTKDITITSLNNSKRAKVICNTNIHTAIMSDTQDLIINIENIEFCGGVVDGGDTYSRNRLKNPSFRVGLGISYAKEINIRNCFFRNIEDIPTYFYQNKSINFINNYSDYCLDLGFVDNDKIIFDGNKITRSGDNGFSISRFNEQCIITNNIIENSFFSGIFVSGFVGDYGVQDFICTNNIIINSNRYGIQADGGSDKFIIANNYIKNVSRKYEGYNVGYLGGIGIICATHESKPKCEFFSITNNTLIDCERGGVLLSGMQFGKVTDNLICNPGTMYYDNSLTIIDKTDSKGQPNNYHICLVSGVSNVIIENNSLVDNRADKTILKYCIFVNDSIINCSIKDNILKGVPQQFYDINIDIAKKHTNKWYQNTLLQSKNFENGNGYSPKFGQSTLSIMENKLNINCVSGQDCGVYVIMNNYYLKNKINYEITFKSSSNIDSVGLLFDFKKSDGSNDRKLIKFVDIIKNYTPNTYYSLSGTLETSIMSTEFNGYQCIICGNMNSLNPNRTAKDVEILHFNLY